MDKLQVFDGRQRDLGGFVVRRVLPHQTRQMVGPFIFFDHLGPTQFDPGHGIDVRPHPHIALATVTYLFSGSLEHRDSLGSVREIRPGDVNWMTAGRGIAHSERTPQIARAAGQNIHGIQSWVALPDGEEDIEPSFVHYPAGVLPRLKIGAVDIKVIAGTAFGLTSPVATLWPTLYVEVNFAQGATLEMPVEFQERAVYVVSGELGIGGAAVKEGQMAVIGTGELCTLRAHQDSRVMLLGGDRFSTARYIWWNFVASSHERIELAKQRWSKGEFASVPGETEFIPLPP
jgi:redox-sensitive bicupin YhaK (pirin superfamily)